MSNTTVRIISGAILALLVTSLMFIGEKAILIGIGIIGPVLIDEIITNFYDQSRTSKRYILAQITFLTGYWFFNFYQISLSSFSFWISAGLVLDILLAVYLFVIYRKSDTLLKIFRATSWGAGIFALIPLLCLSYVTHFENWRILFVAILLLNFSVDTFAFFCGKKFGKHKLWESVSPKKTVEGAVGGVFCSVALTGLYWHLLVEKIDVFTVVVFTIIACCSQIGDLAQSKLKRQFEIKDSSALIPGHGGVYDRVDSLLFVAPLFAFFLMAKFQ